MMDLGAYVQIGELEQIAKDDGTGREHFYRDCPIGICTEKDKPKEET